jgi:hypothetical protein
MASQDQSLPLTSMLPNLLLLIAVSAGIVVTEPSLTSDRMLRPEVAVLDKNQTKGVHSRFWEDPLAVRPVSKEIDTLTSSEAADPRQLDQRIQEKLEPEDRLLVLFVGLDGGGDPSARERRIRTRMAVASALAGRASMLVNSSQEQLKPCLIPIGNIKHGTTMEVFEGLNFTDSRWFSVGRGKVNVVYLDENFISPIPSNMENLVTATGQQANPNCRFSYIGLCRSERLWAFLRAAKKPQDIVPPILPSIQIYSPYATAEDELVWKHISPHESLTSAARTQIPAKEPFFSSSYAFSSGHISGEMHRVGADDGDVAEALIAELNLRGISSKPTKPKNGSKDAVLILADMDRYHSRVFTNSFSRAWQKTYKVDQNSAEGNKYILSDQLSQEVRVIHYAEILEGSTEGNLSAGSTSKNDPSAKQISSPGGRYAAEGTNHFDALRRLPARLHELERIDGVRYRAIGLFGSDVHDKLLLLKALKPDFPGTLFFTNDLDARLWQGEGRAASINLLVAGAFGLTLDSRLQGSVAPFRSSYQTATYLSCLHAIDFKEKRDDPKNPLRHYRPLIWPNHEVELHEVKRSGDHLLSYWKNNSPASTTQGMTGQAAGRPDPIPCDSSMAPLLRVIFRIVIVIVSAFLLFQIWWLMRNNSENLNSRSDTLIYRIGATFIVWICGITAFYMPNLAARDGAAGEVQGLLSGVSAIPTAASNCLIIAIGSVMVLRLFQTRRTAPPYPFTPKKGLHLSDDTTENPTSPEATPSPTQLWQLPSLSDFIGWFVITCEWLGSRFTGKRQRLPQEGYLVLACRRALAQRSAFLGRPPENRLVATYAREALASGGWNLWIRVVIFISGGFFLYSQLDEGMPVPPSVRGEFFRSGFEWSDALAKFTLALIASLAMDRQISMAISLEKFCSFMRRHGEGKHQTAPYPWIERPDIAKDLWTEHGALIRQPDSGDVGLWEMPLLRLASQRFLEISPLMVMPFILLFVMLVSRQQVFENISIPISEMILFSFFLLGPLVAGALAQHNMGQAFELVSERLRKGARFVPDGGFTEERANTSPAKIRKMFFDQEIEFCKDLDARTRYGILLNPLVKAVLLPLGGVGLLELSSHVASFLK